jgi:hypothetical protein
MLREHTVHFGEILLVLCLDLPLLLFYLFFDVIFDLFLLDCGLGHRGGDVAEHDLDFQELPLAVLLGRLVCLECSPDVLDLDLHLAEGLDGFLGFLDDFFLFLFNLLLRLSNTLLMGFGSFLDFLF